MLTARTPSMLNPAHGLSSIDGVAVAAPHFNENLPLRNQPPLVNTIPVALGAQHQVRTFFETDGAGVTHPTPTHLWEAPISSPLPEDTFFLPR